eukprot:CAMPEP_0195285848 /NCGR_PEP_ID=MMETSP0707-20130614/3529_1 /TAXON_ID=33640 /ORGANISM="Asterionellopsis glacialis, Strain CCMP134" /LENGTH=385 /DNA_ID=CAMNT_0040345401 /DNA_START=474 /DNA_END=1631 /DNA_ORIENTATION=-
MSTATLPSTHHNSSSWSTNGSAAPSLLVGQQPPQRKQRPNLIHGGQQVKTQVNGNGDGNGSVNNVNGNGNTNGLNGQNTNGLNGISSAKKNLVNGNNNTPQMNGHTAVNGNHFGHTDTTNTTMLNGASSSLHLQEHENDADCSTSPQYESDLIVVLDMDECLIHSKFLSSKAASQWAYQVQRSHQDKEQQQLSSPHSDDAFCDSFCITLPDGDVVHVNKRPFLHSFLEGITSKYETHVFTAAMPVYASPVLDALDPHGTMFAQRWYRQDCTFCTNVGAYIKDLGRLPPQFMDSPQKKRVVLVDNNPLSFLANPRNGILVSNFYDDPHDTTLEAVLELIHELNECDDVRPTLDKKFGLQEALASIGSSGNNTNGVGGSLGGGGGWQ